MTEKERALNAAYLLLAIKCHTDLFISCDAINNEKKNL